MSQKQMIREKNPLAVEDTGAENQPREPRIYYFAALFYGMKIATSPHFHILF